MERKNKVLAATLFLAGMLIATGMMFSLHDTPEVTKTDTVDTPDINEDLGNKDDDVEKWRELGLGDASPGTSGVVNIYTIDTDEGTLDYDVDIGEGDAEVWEHGDADGFSDGEELAETTPFGEGFDICIEYQFTGAQAVDGGAWNISRVKAFCNSTDLSISSQLMEKSTAFFTTSGIGDADTGKVNFYLKDADGGAGSGFTLGIDESFTIDDIKVYYYG